MSLTRRFKTLASATHTLLFWLASSGIVATASIALYKAYDEYIVKPREPALIERQDKELESLRREKAGLELQNKELTRSNDEMGAVALQLQQSNDSHRKQSDFRIDFEASLHSDMPVIYHPGPRIERSSDGHYWVDHAHDIDYMLDHYDQYKGRLEELAPEMKKLFDPIRPLERPMEEPRFP